MHFDCGGLCEDIANKQPRSKLLLKWGRFVPLSIKGHDLGLPLWWQLGLANFWLAFEKTTPTSERLAIISLDCAKSCDDRV